MISVKRNLAICTALGLLVSLVAGVLLALPAHASASTTPASWQQRTCGAFSRWQDKPTTARLDKLITFALHLPRGWLQADVLELGADVLTARPDQGYVDVAAQYVGEDCHDGSGS